MQMIYEFKYCPAVIYLVPNIKIAYFYIYCQLFNQLQKFKSLLLLLLNFYITII